MNKEAQFVSARWEMVEQIALHAVAASARTGRVSLAERVMKVMASVPRHAFVPIDLQAFAYLDRPLPIGFGKTISQPFIVALMTDLLNVQPEDRVLEIGTGLGYQAAILANLAKTVYSVEIIEELAREAAHRLRQQGYSNIEFKIGDGAYGWPEQALFDKIIVTAAPELIPTALLRQLKSGGRIVIPAGLEDSQQLLLAEKDQTGSTKIEEILPVRFSALTISH